MKRDEYRVMRDRKAAMTCKRSSCRLSLVASHLRAFTLIELLVVISIMGIIAALAVPALKNMGKSNIQASAARQMLDDVGRARQLAISQHTTVYMVFVRTNFWNQSYPPYAFATAWWNGPNGLVTAQQTVASNLCDKQMTGYTFVSLRSVGDQPGQGRAHYLAPWQSLPEGTFISQLKFQMLPPPPAPTAARPPFIVNGNNTTYQFYGFCITNTIPFPTEDSPSGATSYPIPRNSPPLFDLPYIAFNYLGQLTFDGQNMAWHDEYIPLAQGSVSPAIDVSTKAPVIPVNGSGAWPSVTETPPGNSTNSMFNLIHIDRLTGRATLESQQVQ